MKKRFAAVLLLTLSTTANADTWLLRTNIQQLKALIQEHRAILKEAKEASKTSFTRTQFSFDRYEHDLNIIEAGLSEFLDAPMEPGPIEELYGQYTDYKEGGDN